MQNHTKRKTFKSDLDDEFRKSHFLFSAEYGTRLFMALTTSTTLENFGEESSSNMFGCAKIFFFFLTHLFFYNWQKKYEKRC